MTREHVLSSNLTPRAATHRARHFYWLIWLCLLLLVNMILSVAIGSRPVAASDIWAALHGQTVTIEQASVARRIPRTLLALIAGAALGLAGATMQGLTRNPLADPGILGVNLGASLAVVIGMAYFSLTAAFSIIWVAILGAGMTSICVYIIGSLGPNGATPLKLALAGAAMSIALSSLITGIVLPRGDIAEGVRAWLVGGVGGATFLGLSQILPFILAGLILSQLSAPKLNALALGDDMATGLGENVILAHISIALSAVLLCGAATAICGPIGFVGLVAPHICRIFAGLDHRWILPFSALLGANFLIVSDVLGRVIAWPTEIEVGIIAAFLGAPFFIWIVRKQKLRAL